MTLILTVLCISLVFVFGDAESPPASVLEEEIKQAEKEKAIVNRQNEKLRHEIKTKAINCWKEVKAEGGKVSNGTSETDHQQRVIEDLFRKLMWSYDEVDKLKEIHINIDKLKLGVLVIDENIKELKHRRGIGWTNRCLRLEKFENSNSSESSGALTLSGGRIGVEIVLQNKLRLLKTKVRGAKFIQKELKKKLKVYKKACNKAIGDLNTILKQIKNNSKQAEVTINELLKEIAKQKKKIKDLKPSKHTEEELESWIKRARNALKKYEQYFLDAICYAMLMRDVEALAEPRTDPDNL